MSLGPSTLSSLLAQKLDTALGATASEQTRSGAHPDALRPLQPAVKIIKTESQQEKLYERADNKARQSVERKEALTQERQNSRLVNQLQRLITSNQFTPSAPTTLGLAARTILSLLSTHQVSQPVQGKTPLLEARQLTKGLNLALGKNQQSTAPSIATNTVGTPTSLASAFTQALIQNVQQSGLFYESHLGQLVKGQVLPTQLQQQPQAQAHLRETGLSHEQGKTPVHQHQSATQTVSALSQSIVDPSTQQIVRQQLDLLANQLFVWRGEAWAGVPMELEIQRDQEQKDNETKESESDEQTPWQTKLRVELPNLGEIEVSLHLFDGTLRMHLSASDSADQLDTHLHKLAQRLQSQEILIDQLQVNRRHEPQ